MRLLGQGDITSNFSLMCNVKYILERFNITYLNAILELECPVLCTL